MRVAPARAARWLPAAWSLLIGFLNRGESADIVSDAHVRAVRPDRRAVLVFLALAPILGPGEAVEHRFSAVANHDGVPVYGLNVLLELQAGEYVERTLQPA